MTIQEQVDRLEQLRQKLEGCESLEEAVDLLGEFDAAAKELIDSIDRATRRILAPWLVNETGGPDGSVSERMPNSLSPRRSHETSHAVTMRSRRPILNHTVVGSGRRSTKMSILVVMRTFIVPSRCFGHAD